MIDRKISPRLLEDLAYFLVVGLIGPRQAGKTTLAKQLAGQLTKPVVYFDLELDSDQRRLADAETFLAQYADHCVILDEAQ